MQKREIDYIKIKIVPIIIKFGGNCTIRYTQIQIQTKSESVSEELALFTWSSVGYMRSTCWPK